MRPVAKQFSFVENPRHLYSLLVPLFSAETCAPRMRQDWTKNNPTLGHCSITAFLVKEIFGGEVYGVPLGDGNYHCFNVVDGVLFDLTSEQFGDRRLDYTLNYPQSEAVHFAKAEKKQRAALLRTKLIDCLKK